MFEMICHYLSFLIQSKLPSTRLRKLRDLFFGIILNLACNIEEQEMMMYMMHQIDILNVLLIIVTDPRNDWPTHGAA